MFKKLSWKHLRALIESILGGIFRFSLCTPTFNQKKLSWLLGNDEVGTSGKHHEKEELNVEELKTFDQEPTRPMEMKEGTNTCMQEVEIIVEQ